MTPYSTLGGIKALDKPLWTSVNLTKGSNNKKRTFKNELTAGTLKQVQAPNSKIGHIIDRTESALMTTKDLTKIRFPNRQLSETINNGSSNASPERMRKR